MQVLVGQVWRYTGESKRGKNAEYIIKELLPAVKVPSWGWHRGIRYVPLIVIAGAENDYTRVEEDFLKCFTYVRG